MVRTKWREPIRNTITGGHGFVLVRVDGVQVGEAVGGGAVALSTAAPAMNLRRVNVIGTPPTGP